jgi:hypothetical protein
VQFVPETFNVSSGNWLRCLIFAWYNNRLDHLVPRSERKTQNDWIQVVLYYRRWNSIPLTSPLEMYWHKIDQWSMFMTLHQLTSLPPQVDFVLCSCFQTKPLAKGYSFIYCPNLDFMVWIMVSILFNLQ